MGDSCLSDSTWVLGVALVLAGSGAIVISAQEAPTTWAVLVGVNDYVAYEDEEGGDLRGAEHDALAMREVLLDEWNVPSSQVRTLLSRDATRAAMEEALTRWLPENVRSQDRVVFFFAGHGSQVVDQDGDETDGLDETICPTDVLATSYERDIRDDELDVWIDGLPTKNVVVILDSCHSGTGTRVGVGYARSRSLSRNRGGQAEGGASSTAPEEVALGASEGVLELAGAAPDQYAMDMRFRDPTSGESFYGGAFTTHLVRQLRSAPAGATFEDLYWATYHSMKADRFAQDPQLSGPVDQTLWRSSPREPETAAQTLREMRVLSVGSEGVLVAVGPEHVVPGAVLESQRNAILRVDRVQDDRAVATTLQGQVELDERLEISALILPDRVLRVAAQGVSARLAGRLMGFADEIEDLEVIRGEDRDADLAIRPLEEGSGVGVYARDGSVRAELSADAELLADQLRKELAIHRLVLLENPRPPFEVELSVVGDDNSARPGDPLVFRVRSEAEGYLVLLDLGTDGTLTLLYPNRWTSEMRLPAGQEVLLPMEDEPFILEAAAPIGMGMVKALVTKEPLEISVGGEAFLSSELASNLTEQIKSALTQRVGARGIKLVQKNSVETDSWASALATYRIVEGESEGR